MEERIIDDEYGRGIRMKTTKDGYVDVTDAALDKEAEEETAEEMTFEFPDIEEDDEDLVGLSPEEAAARARRYEELLEQGRQLLEEENYPSAERTYERALGFDDVATAASVGYWRAKTENFANPDVLIDEYLEAGYENLEFDLGYEAVEIIKKEHKNSFAKRYKELTDEETPLKKEFEEKREARRSVLQPRLKKAWIAFACTALPFVVSLVLAVFFGLQNFTVSDGRYIPVTIVFAVVAVAAFGTFGVFTNKLINSRRIFRTNESLSSTEAGQRLMEIAEYKELYSYFVE